KRIGCGYRLRPTAAARLATAPRETNIGRQNRLSSRCGGPHRATSRRAAQGPYQSNVLRHATALRRGYTALTYRRRGLPQAPFVGAWLQLPAGLPSRFLARYCYGLGRAFHPAI